MTGRRKLALGIGIAILLSYAVAIIGFVSYGLPALRLLGKPEALQAVRGLQESRVAFVLGISSEFAIVALVLGHLVHAARTRQLSGSERVFWVAALLIGNFVALPFFWYLQVWRPAVLAPARAVSDEQRFAAFLQRRSQQKMGGPPTTRGTA